MPQKVVFTGPAVDSQGRSITRANLVKACEGTGTIIVQSSVRGDTDLLVASRTDTVKAKKAAASGLPVLTYPEFLATRLRGVEIDSGGPVDPYTDKLDPDLLVPVFLDDQQLELLDIL